MSAGLLIPAMLLDAALGEPGWLWNRLPHPAVLMGRAIGWADERFNRPPDQRRNGILLVVTGLAASLLIGCVITNLPGGTVWEVLLAAILLAQRSLCDHVSAVGDGLRYGTQAGRQAVARIVGRDVQMLDASGVARGAIESGAENFSDGVVAPAFWFLIGGLPGLLAYKFVNTADSMIGYRTQKHEDFGWAAARLDDVVNWIPARLSAALIWAAGGGRGSWTDIRADASLHRSPNAGWPEAAMATTLDVALSGPRVYAGTMTTDAFVNDAGKHDIGVAEVEAAVKNLWRAWAVSLCLTVLVLLLT